MISLGTPQLRGGVHIFFFYKVSFAKNSNVQLPWHEVEAAINAPVPELKKLIEEILMEKVKFTQSEILRHFLLKVEDVVLDVEADHLANRQVGDLVHCEHGESLEDELMLIVMDDRRVFDQEICWRRNGHPDK